MYIYETYGFLLYFQYLVNGIVHYKSKCTLGNW